MNIVSVNKLTMWQGPKCLFTEVSFGVDSEQKIALIGVNGCGKTTLLAHLAHIQKSPNPAISIRQNLRVRYLAQVPVFNPEHTILEHLFQSDTPVSRITRDYDRCLAAMAIAKTPALEAELERVMAEMDRLEAWVYEARVRSILTELGLTDLDLKMGDLSGGMVKKIALAVTLLEEADLLILDEPTNHLDIDTIEWLEAQLKRTQAAIVMVTHDRYFLDKVCNAIYEIDQQQVFQYTGSYAAYLEERDLRYQIQEKGEDKIRTILRVELDWLRQGPKARSTKQRARKDRIDALLHRACVKPEEVLELSVSGRRLGKKILSLKHVSKAFGDLKVIDDFSWRFKRNEKIGILGPNGSGKTTLFNIINGKLEPDSGYVDQGVNTVFGYFDQLSMSFDLDMTIYDHVQSIGDRIELADGTELSASKLLERFLFPSQMLSTPIGKLSGGERRRLHLVCTLLENPNFLFFDEPTNDLDIKTLSVLEDFLLNFGGCVLVISHDRYFMDRVVDHLLIFEGNGLITHFPGTYSDYVDTKTEVDKLLAQEKRKDKPAPVVEKPAEKKKLTFNEKREYDRLEAEIDDLEKEKIAIEQDFNSGQIQGMALQELGMRYQGVLDTLATKWARWEALAEWM